MSPSDKPKGPRTPVDWDALDAPAAPVVVVPVVVAAVQPAAARAASSDAQDSSGDGDEPPQGELDVWFSELTGGKAPHDWQRALTTERAPRSRLIRIPTGMGKTLGVLAAWSWHRLARADERWPRRLVWCLPMRVLVEQTDAVVREALARSGRLWDGSSDHAGRVGVHVLMGGADAGGDWELFPEECAVLIGTQDMLLSRALNRGYAAGRARWPLEFGLLSQDALWIMDEVQLMDVGLATSGQLQAFLDDDAQKGIQKGLRGRHTWWMSATLQPAWLRTVDTQARHDAWARDACSVPAADRAEGLGAIRKSLATCALPTTDARGLAKLALDAHRELPDGEHGRVTLVVCNTVDRACATFDALRALAPTQELELVHSRFRPQERAAWRSRFLSREQCRPETDRMIVATQVVEAGVDISAGHVVTELAPWPSLVQRFGRCARYAGTGSVTVVDRGRDEGTAPPYEAEQLEAAWQELEAILREGADVGTASLEAFEEGLEPARRQSLYPYEPKHLLLRRELDELFDTTPDLTGADLDISRFIRSGEERDLQVFWLEVPKPQKKGRPPAPPRDRSPSREELCSIPFLRARDWLCGEETKSNRKPRLLASKRAWVWDWIDGDWVPAERATLTPGRLVCVAADCGGYRLERGFDPRSTERVLEVQRVALPPDAAARLRADNAEDSEELSASRWKTIACHGGEVSVEVTAIARQVGLPRELERVLALAGLWHDLGKSHPAWQGAIRLDEPSDRRPDRQDLAKAPSKAFPRPPKTYRTRDDRDVRPGLRHELASALALFAVLARHDPEHPALLGPFAEALRLAGQSVGHATAEAPPTPCERAVLDCTAEEFDLLAYLVLCHHGKVRASLHAGPKDQEYRDRDGRGLPIRGVRAGDVLPSISLDAGAPPLPALVLSLEPATLGLSGVTGRSWRERTLGLVARFGPGALAWLESLIIAADRRASRLATPDPAFAQGGGT